MTTTSVIAAAMPIVPASRSAWFWVRFVVAPTAEAMAPTMLVSRTVAAIATSQPAKAAPMFTPPNLSCARASCARRSWTTSRSLAVVRW
jgi:hypothetical protein